MSAPAPAIRLAGQHFKDAQGRTLLLRGVNLGGNSKVPTLPDGATHLTDGFFDHRDVSFVGRPFPLEEADEHFARLRAWGFNFLRLLVTWEAIEHAGPGQYDADYLDYLEAIVAKAGEHGLALVVDPHQDVWSRFSGGDGAPGWTLEAAGFDLPSLHATGAAIVHQLYGDRLPPMIWPTNGSKLAAATMFTLFFGGDDFAPLCRVDGEPIQQYLQRHYIGAIEQVVCRLRRFAHVVGYETMNEPLPGYIGHADLGKRLGRLAMGPTPTPLQSMALGDGLAQEVAAWPLTFGALRMPGRVRINEAGARAWRAGSECIWRRHGLWEIDGAGQPRLLRPDYFARAGGRPVDFTQDYYYPFAQRFARHVRAIDDRAAIFVQSEVTHDPPRWDAADAGALVYAPHWYDVMTLFRREYLPWLALNVVKGRVAVTAPLIRRSFAAQMRSFRRASAERLHGAPVLLGEFGIPFDLNDGRAYRTGDFSAQEKVLDRTMRALEDALLSGTIWNYTADNTNAHGDLWNGEDLSIFSRDQMKTGDDARYSGGRALAAAIRPYARAVAGEPLSMSFDRRRRRFEFSFYHAPEVDAATEIFVPRLHFGRGCVVQVSDGHYTLDEAAETLHYIHDPAQAIHTLRIDGL